MERAHMRLRELGTPWARTTLTNDVLAVEHTSLLALSQYGHRTMC